MKLLTFFLHGIVSTLSFLYLDIAKQVLDRCVVSNPKTRDPKNKDFEVVLDYSFVEDHGNAR